MRDFFVSTFGIACQFECCRELIVFLIVAKFQLNSQVLISMLVVILITFSSPKKIYSPSPLILL